MMAIMFARKCDIPNSAARNLKGGLRTFVLYVIALFPLSVCVILWSSSHLAKFDFRSLRSLFSRVNQCLEHFSATLAGDRERRNLFANALLA